MSEERPPRPGPPSFFNRITRRTERYFARNGFQLQRLGFFIAFPIGIYWMFSDVDRVEWMYSFVRLFELLPLLSCWFVIL